MVTKLEQIARLAEKEPSMVFTSIAHLIDKECLTRSFYKLRKWAATGLDNRQYVDYEYDLAANISALHTRLKTGRYKAPNIKRVWISKGQGKEKRPLGISTIEDKIVQRAVSDLLSIIYEPIFQTHSYGFRLGKSPHQALSYIRNQIMGHLYKWLIDADIKSCFDSFDHKILVEILKRRVNDGAIIKLLYQWMKAGIVDGNQMFKPESGVPQGNIISPLLCNIYLHEVLDQWLSEIRGKLKGRMYFTRFADDFIIGFEYKEDAERVFAVMPKRFKKFGLTIHPEKTELIEFEPGENKNTKTFDFLGFTHFWAKSQRGFWVVKRKTKRAKVNYICNALYNYCKNNRHLSVREQWTDLCMKIRGYYAYFAIRGNFIFLKQIHNRATKFWFKWLNRRSQYNSYTWKGFRELLKVFRLPYPKITHYNV